MTSGERRIERQPGTGPSPGRASAALALAALVGLAALAAFAVSVRGEFVWDDRAFLPAGPKLLGVADPRVFFASGLWDYARVPASVPIYRPLALVAMWLAAPLLGGDPAGWHLLSLAFHVVASALVYLLARRIAPGAHPFAALAAGLVFAVHPVHTEAVNFVVAFHHPLATVFALLAALAQLRHARGGQARWLIAAAVAALAAALTSEGALPLPFLLVALEWMQRRRVPSPAVLAIAAAPLALAIALRARALAAPVPLHFDAASVGRAAWFAAAYVRELLLPMTEPAYLSIPRERIVGPAGAAFAVVGLGAAVVAVARTPADQRNRPAFALAWILAFLAPLAAAATNATPFFAPRALYLPSVGIALLLAWAAERLAPSPSLPWKAGLAVATLAGILAGNVASLGWRDNLRVHQRMLVADPRNGWAHLAVASMLSERGELAEVERHLLDAIRFADSPDVRLGAMEAAGAHYGSRGATDEAERLLRAVVSEAPDRPVSWIGLGNVALSRGDLIGARDAYARARRLDPRNYEAAYNLALVLDRLGDAAGAAETRRVAELLRPGR